MLATVSTSPAGAHASPSHPGAASLACGTPASASSGSSMMMRTGSSTVRRAVRGRADAKTVAQPNGAARRRRGVPDATAVPLHDVRRKGDGGRARARACLDAGIRGCVTRAGRDRGSNSCVRSSATAVTSVSEVFVAGDTVDLAVITGFLRSPDPRSASRRLLRSSRNHENRRRPARFCGDAR